ncbi:hypothetical protein [Nostoc sp. JL33]|uniref:hypothetical protein n=1 Tax=Nostoc sp. JL33 TaxID=2815396 RepID=UPI0025F1D001|nr:hypothetical protein [Nostoc sp. JL33]MBN3874428.1 hypothetical protein [Nostoc sp. JL33]
MSYQQQVSRKSNSNPDTSIHNTQKVKDSNAALTQQYNIENQQYQQDRFEATKLKIQSKNNKNNMVTPQQQERSTVLQTKKTDLWRSSLEKADRYGHHLANVSVNSSYVSSQQPIQAKFECTVPAKNLVLQLAPKNQPTANESVQGLKDDVDWAMNLLGNEASPTHNNLDTAINIMKKSIGYREVSALNHGGANPGHAVRIEKEKTALRNLEVALIAKGQRPSAAPRFSGPAPTTDPNASPLGSATWAAKKK